MKNKELIILNIILKDITACLYDIEIRTELVQQYKTMLEAIRIRKNLEI